MLLKLVGQYYKPEEIEAAKDLLYDNFPEEARPKHLRKQAKQGVHKAENIVKDIVINLAHQYL